jgi:hypothetical protein
VLTQVLLLIADITVSTLTAPSGVSYGTISKSITGTGTTRTVTITIPFSTTTAVTNVKLDDTAANKITVTVGGIDNATTLSSVSTTATITPSTIQPYNKTKSTASTSSLTVQLRNSDGRIDLAAPLTIANGFQIRVTDPDRNIDTTARDVPHTAVLNTTSPTTTVTANGSGAGTAAYEVGDGSNNPTLNVSTTGPTAGVVTLTSILTFSADPGTVTFNAINTTGTAASLDVSTLTASNVTIAPHPTDNTKRIVTITVPFITTAAVSNAGLVVELTVNKTNTAPTLDTVSTTATILTSGINLRINGVGIPVVFKETDDNTNIFLPDLAGNKIEIVPVANDPAGAAPDPDQYSTR